MSDSDEERGPGGMDAIDGEPLNDSDEPGGMSGIPDPDPDEKGHGSPDSPSRS
jgi:hypothetical protein